MRRRTCVIIGGGVSLTLSDVLRVKNRADVLVVNDGYRIAPFADHMYACDGDWWRASPVGIADPNHIVSKRMLRPGIPRWTQDKVAADAFGLDYIESRNEPGLSLDPKVIHQGENGGYQAIGLAAVTLSYDRLILLGMDMTGKGHWFGSHPVGLNDATDFGHRVRNFEQLAIDLRASGVEVINASRVRGLRMFECKPIEEIFP